MNCSWPGSASVGRQWLSVTCCETRLLDGKATAFFFFYTGLRETVGYASWTSVPSFFFFNILAFLKQWASPLGPVFGWGYTLGCRGHAKHWGISLLGAGCMGVSHIRGAVVIDLALDCSCMVMAKCQNWPKVIGKMPSGCETNGSSGYYCFFFYTGLLETLGDASWTSFFFKSHGVHSGLQRACKARG